MREEEAKYIGELVQKIAETGKGPVVNIGSSSQYIREVEQPHIHKYLFAPLEKMNVTVVHSDLKDQKGIDIAGDIFDPDLQNQLRDLQPQIMLVCNLLEHLEVEVRNQLPKVLGNIVKPGRFLIISVPYEYPLHFDPIDTYYRPSPEDLYSLFPSYELIDAQIVTSSTFLPELWQLDLRVKLKMVARAVTPFYRPHKWLGMMHRFTFLFRPYKVSCVALRRLTNEK